MEEKTELLEKEVKALKQTMQELDAKLQSLREDGEGLRTEQQEIKGRLYELEIAEKNVNSHLELYDQEKSALLEGDEDKKRRKKSLKKSSHRSPAG